MKAIQKKSLPENQCFFNINDSSGRDLALIYNSHYTNFGIPMYLMISKLPYKTHKSVVIMHMLLLKKVINLNYSMFSLNKWLMLL